MGQVHYITCHWSLNPSFCPPYTLPGDIMTVNVNLAGLPALAVPCGTTAVHGTEVPLAVQLIGGPWEEAKLLRIAHAFQATRPPVRCSQYPKDD